MTAKDEGASLGVGGLYVYEDPHFSVKVYGNNFLAQSEKKIPDSTSLDLTAH